MIGMAKRNLKLFFRDKSAVFFSLLAVFIIIGLYALFLGDVWTGSMEGMPEVRVLMDSWILSGLLAVTSVTTTMGAFGTMVDDKAKNITKDFSSSPDRRGRLAGGYILSSFIVGVIMTLVALVLVQGYILIEGGAFLGVIPLFKVIGLVLLTTFTNTSLVLFLVSFFRSSNAFATASTILGTLIGFVTGIYLPVGQLPDAVGWIVKLFPVSHAAVLFRQVMMAGPMETSFAGAPASAVAEFEELMGVTLHFGDTLLPAYASVLILFGTAAVFYPLAVWNLTRKRR